MPEYTYRHREAPTPDGCDERFVVSHSIRDPALTACPRCGAPVEREIGVPQIAKTLGNSHLRNLGFSKLVRRDSGVYENVSAQEGEKKIVTQQDLGD